MAELTTVSFGPQHPVLPEPIHLDLELKDEKVVRAVPSIATSTADWKSWSRSAISSSSSMSQSASAASAPSGMAGAMRRPSKG